MQTIVWKILILLLGILAGGVIYAQPALYLRNLSQEITAQAYQPAYLALQDSFFLQIGGGIGYGSGSNVLTMDRLFLDNQYLSESVKDDIVGQLQDDNRLQLGFLLDGSANIRIKQQNFSVFTRRVTHTYARFQDPRSVGLLLYGNARYAGETLTDDEITLGLTSYQEIGIGTAWQLGKWAAGIRIKGLLGIQATLLQHLDYSLFTEKLGTKLSMQSNYEFFRAQSDGTAGMGLGIDLGAVYELNSKLALQFAVQDLGLIQWEGEQYDQTVSFDYDGVEITQLFNTDFSSANNFIPSDTLRSLLIPSPTSASYRHMLPALASIGASYQWNEANQLFGNLLFGLSPQAMAQPLPLLNLAYHRKLGSFFMIGVNAYGGGLDQYGLGAIARANLQFSDKLRISAFGSMDNALGILSPPNGKGQSFHAGLTIGLK